MTYSLTRLDAEMCFVKRLKKFGHGADIFAGDTTPELRRDRLRRSILDNMLPHARFGRREDGKIETFKEAFERFYSEPLVRRAAAT